MERRTAGVSRLVHVHQPAHAGHSACSHRPADHAYQPADAGRSPWMLLADVRHQRHEARPLDGVLDGALEGGAVAAALAAEQLALAGAKLLERLHVLVIDEGWPRAALLCAEPAPILPSSTELLADHRLSRPTFGVTT